MTARDWRTAPTVASLAPSGTAGAAITGSADELWGPGDQADAEPFDRGTLDDGTGYDLIWGEHPHSRSDDRTYARFDGPVGEEGESIVGFDGHRVTADIGVRTYNYLKTSELSGDEVRRGGEYTISLNGVPVYAGFVRDAGRGLQEAQRTLAALLDLPVQLWEADEWTPEHRTGLIGRPIFYRETAAVVTAFYGDQGAVIVETAGGQPFPPPAWAQGDDGWYYDGESTLKDDVLSPHIWWFRDA